jgi:hypothetical protein
VAVELVIETFAERVGESFELTTGGGESIEVALSACEETPYTLPAEWKTDVERTPFSLLFHDPDASRVAPQQNFTLRHPELGEFRLFMVPLGPDERGMRYEAVIS